MRKILDVMRDAYVAGVCIAFGASLVYVFVLMAKLDHIPALERVETERIAVAPIVSVATDKPAEVQHPDIRTSEQIFQDMKKRLKEQEQWIAQAREELRVLRDGK